MLENPRGGLSWGGNRKHGASEMTEAIGTYFIKVQGFIKEYSIMGKSLGKESASVGSLCNLKQVI